MFSWLPRYTRVEKGEIRPHGTVLLDQRCVMKFLRDGLETAFILETLTSRIGAQIIDVIMSIKSMESMKRMYEKVSRYFTALRET